jgi:hypothetical protein
VLKQANPFRKDLLTEENPLFLQGVHLSSFKIYYKSVEKSQKAGFDFHPLKPGCIYSRVL